MAPEQEKPLRELRSVWGQTEADVIKALLESHGISSVFRGRILHSIYPFSMDGLGEVKILVLEEDYEAAKSILDEFPKPADEEESEKGEKEP
jgi:hypothetical protein